MVPLLTMTESVFTPDRLAAARFSVSAQYMAATARNTLEGAAAVSYYEKGKEIPLIIKIRDEDIRSIEDLENTLLPLENSLAPLRTLGAITEVNSEKVLYRYNRRDAKQISAPVQAGQWAAYDLESPGADELGEMARSSIFLLAVTVLLLYLTMGAQFESFIIPLLLLIALPPAFSGAFLFLLLSNNSLNINSIIALIILFGVSINNSILLYESCISVKTINENSIVGSCRNKLQAILITNITTIIALVPFAVDPLHTNTQASLSIAVIGGLLFSLVLVLTVVPVCFLYLLPAPAARKAENR
jgi:multidrug efflux pump subunit AcrB